MSGSNQSCEGMRFESVDFEDISSRWINSGAADGWKSLKEVELGVEKERRGQFEIEPE